MQRVTGSLQCVRGPTRAGQWSLEQSDGTAHTVPDSRIRQDPDFSQLTHDSRSCKVPSVLLPKFISNQLILSFDLPRRDRPCLDSSSFWNFP